MLARAGRASSDGTSDAARRTLAPMSGQARSGADAFGGFIGPENLRSWVEGSAPYLFDGSHARQGELAPPRPGRLIDVARGPLGWWQVLCASSRLEATERPTPEGVSDYFALCLAAHWASAATFVPTDVDAKIRRALWTDQQSAEEFERMAELALALDVWDVRGFSARTIALPQEWELGRDLSGHDGERMSVLAGGFLAALGRARDDLAVRFEEALERELRREARAFELLGRTPGRELDWLRAAAVLTHNAGDVDQGLAPSRAPRAGAGRTEPFLHLARLGPERFGGAFARAAAIYREVLAAEGHRNYPLRKIKALRREAELLLPIGPFLDAWGARAATSNALATSVRAEVVTALVEGVRKVPGQHGYQRALAGFAEAFPRGLESDELAPHLPAAVRRALRSSELRRALAVSRRSFESACRRRAEQAVARAAPSVTTTARSPG